MTIDKDPEGYESSVLHALVDFKDQLVLEIGCGRGRLTWLYAEKAARVIAIDPDETDIETANASLPDRLKPSVTFIQTTIADFARVTADREFDIALFAWSL
jgi:2-polyprenyl-3-methyl-5-hydroxy-6-metoxy-1,4-benzoquinol methylase